MFSTYPIDSTRYLHIESGNRNRSLFPYSTDFEIPLPNNPKGNDSNNNGLYALDPVYNGYPSEFGYFGLCSNGLYNFPFALQLSDLAVSSSNFYNSLIVQDETVCPRDYSKIFIYDSTTALTGYARSAFINQWTNNGNNAGNPGSLYSIRKEPPLFQGSGVGYSKTQFRLTNSGIFGVNVSSIGFGYGTYQTNSDAIDYSNVPVMFVNPIDPVSGQNAYSGYAVSAVAIQNTTTTTVSNILLSSYEAENSSAWLPSTRFKIGDVIYNLFNDYYVITAEGITSITPPTSTTPNVPITDGSVTYYFIGNTPPTRLKWYPSTAYNSGDILFYGNYTYVVTNGGVSDVTAINVSPVTPPSIYVPVTDGTLTLSFIYWSSTNEGYGYGPSVCVDNWYPVTQVLEGTYVRNNGDLYSVYSSGTTGNAFPAGVHNILTPFQDGTAWLMFVNGIPSVPPSVIIGVEWPALDVQVYVGQTFFEYGFNFVVQVAGNTGGGPLGLVANTYYFSGGGSARLYVTGEQAVGYAVLNDKVPGVSAALWTSNTAYAQNTLVYYRDTTFTVLNNGISGNSPPEFKEQQINGTCIFVLRPYRDPYAGFLLKITQIHTNDNTFVPFYSRIKSFNPNTLVLKLESPIVGITSSCNYELLSYTEDNFQPLQFTLSPFWTNISAPEIFYDISVTSLTLPNLPVFSVSNINVLTSSQLIPFDSYPRIGSFSYIIVTLKNTNNTGQAFPGCSNNKFEYNATFRLTVNDTNPILSSPFTRLQGSETRTMRINPNDTLRMTITDPFGNLLIFANPTELTNFLDFVVNGAIPPDTLHYIGNNYSGFGCGWLFNPLLPLPSNPNLQVSATFSIHPHV